MAVGPPIGTQNDKIRASSDDPSAGYLIDKITSPDGTVSITESSCNCDIELSAAPGGFVENWRKYTIDFDDPAFSTGTATTTISIETSEPTGMIITNTYKKHSVPFSGGSISQVDVRIGYQLEYDTAYDVSTGMVATKGQSEAPLYALASIGIINAVFDFTGGVDTDLTAGSVDLWIKTVVLT